MKLQVAFDCNSSTKKICECVDLISGSMDFIEVGTPLIVEKGLSTVQELRPLYPHLKILADVKIMDGGFYEANAAFEAGADIVTALAVAEDATLKGAIDAARKHGGEIMVDMIAHPNLPLRIGEIDAMGVDFICLHTAKDTQGSGKDFASFMREVKGFVKTAKLALAGGINPKNIESYTSMEPDVIIIGEGITAADNPAEAARMVREKMGEH